MRPYHVHVILALLISANLLASSGCKRTKPFKGQWYQCTCPYLTDFDDVAKHSLDVCVPEGHQPNKDAYECATHLTHGPSEACTCGAAKGTCDGSQMCKSNEYK